MAHVLHLLLLWLLVRSSEPQGYVGNGLGLGANIEKILPSVTHRANGSQSFYGIMFDAGSTGTRIHIYNFIQKGSNRLPVLDNEMFQSVKPGLSAYADMPEKAGDSVRQLLEVAKSSVPHVEWKQTPVMLKATAGLRMLPPAKAHALLQEVQDVFDDSPFYVPAESVSIMNGTSEGVLAWVTVNFLTGQLYPNTKRSVGILDLGGGSTQITFLPKVSKTSERFPADYTARFSMFDTTYKLYTHSYSGNGIKAAQLAAIGALGSKDPEGKVFQSSCLPKNYKGKISFGGLIYKVSGKPGGSTGYKSCYREMLKVVKGVIQEPDDMEDSWIYAFSYYFDHAVEAGLVDEDRGGAVRVRDFKQRAKEVCSKVSMYNPDYPFLCMDLTYITCLLRSGYGFEEKTVLELTKKLHNVEASWALGATLGYFEHFSIV
ncbi:ectonucleoside triphosphate diphosphohydrolase 5 isoform X1 [Hemibagrus wyckioides]|uniref:ectonucleoside triphosphate diphosphohydrolase 5 isoform X1 n=1 Tax=Hemibagrus wyckioides TaxID=337641 RepID=UPI00266D7841|nr:ectonucleoside triphosphate diphosphohydrolase 5 isoform X1 [Hemibagrus wyckioides]XP_058235313.1 ectonucleoside triphosphate diphosphohydrolase 5 isoform X1 [Hemibagrus wyckioides]